VKPDINLVKVDPQLSHNKHPVDGALVGAGSLWPLFFYCSPFLFFLWLCPNGHQCGILEQNYFGLNLETMCV
jgi:hypothetical protein